MNLIGLRLGDERGLLCRARQLETSRAQAGGDNSDDLAEVLAVRDNGGFVRFSGRIVGLPCGGPACDGCLCGCRQVTVDAGDHTGGQIALPLQGLSPGQWLLGLDGGR